MVRNNKGFSLVELMVVVAIIGILAAIAVPNFQRFAAKSKQSEAKSDLSALYTAERAFQAEWQEFDANFVVVGYAPTGQMRYDHGFAADGGIVLPVNYTGPAADGNLSASAWCGANPTTCALITNPIAPAAPAGSSISATAFVAVASADLSGGSTVQDLWSVNEAKVFCNGGAGCAAGEVGANGLP